MAALTLFVSTFSSERGAFKFWVPEAFGGPEALGAGVEGTATLDSQLVLDSQGMLGGDIGVPEEFSGYFFVFEDSVAGWANPMAQSLSWVPKRDGVIAYEVQEGDSPATIAAHFGISFQTILWANNLTQDSVIQPGQRLVILPVSGVLHEVKAGETMGELGRIYGVSEAKIAAMNGIASPDNLSAGMKLVVPGGEPQGARLAAASAVRELAQRLAGFFRAPTTGWNWGKLHRVNAVDIANACGTPVYAAASGFVTSSKAGGWNSGYGSMIQVNHANDTSTVYAHLSGVLVSDGAYVNQGDLIGTIGNTGRTHGPTGCHLHFEVRGGPNPFVRY
ncbi:MAG: peptidoglycan DD-metalloendopeptidase family protein [Parcubacteria group bacterium]|nr:peptidoglycan DD-metalloendopeptidase family protein [Parcubacteria group bacterium]